MSFFAFSAGGIRTRAVLCASRRRIRKIGKAYERFTGEDHGFGESKAAGKAL